jgi:anti-sigma regulatory factor (Ser/Thr protein kinase)
VDLRVRLELESVPESVQLVRSVIRTLATTAELERSLLDDLNTAVSEACNNVVLHAYPLGSSGPLTFSMVVRGDQVEAIVRDRGCGMRRVSIRNRGLGMGVVVISALADHTEFKTDDGIGTEVRMKFRRPTPAPTVLDQLDLGVWLSDLEASVVQQVRLG